MTGRVTIFLFAATQADASAMLTVLVNQINSHPVASLVNPPRIDTMPDGRIVVLADVILTSPNDGLTLAQFIPANWPTGGGKVFSNALPGSRVISHSCPQGDPGVLPRPCYQESTFTDVVK